jgi:hypothetical protein
MTVKFGSMLRDHSISKWFQEFHLSKTSNSCQKENHPIKLPISIKNNRNLRAHLRAIRGNHAEEEAEGILVATRGRGGRRLIEGPDDKQDLMGRGYYERHSTRGPVQVWTVPQAVGQGSLEGHDDGQNLTGQPSGGRGRMPCTVADHRRALGLGNSWVDRQRSRLVLLQPCQGFRDDRPPQISPSPQSNLKCGSIGRIFCKSSNHIHWREWR